MRRIALAALMGTAGLVIAAGPSLAYTTYQLQNGGGGANFANSGEQQPSDNGFSFSAKTTTSNPYDPFDQSNNFGPQQSQQQQDLSRDMNWQGTGYYFRPSN